MVNGNIGIRATKSFLGPNRQFIMLIIKAIIVFQTIFDMATLTSHTTI